MPGTMEWIIIAVVVLILFGAAAIPRFGGLDEQRVPGCVPYAFAEPFREASREHGIATDARDEQHHPGRPAADLGHRTGEERPAGKDGR